MEVKRGDGLWPAGIPPFQGQQPPFIPPAVGIGGPNANGAVDPVQQQPIVQHVMCGNLPPYPLLIYQAKVRLQEYVEVRKRHPPFESKANFWMSSSMKL